MQLQAIQEAAASMAWWFNGIITVIVLVSKFFKNTKLWWGIVGIVLLGVALGNAVILGPAATDRTSQLAVYYGTVVLGALGATLVATWVSDGAT